MSLPGEIIISVIIPALNEEKLIKQTLAQFTPELKAKYKIEVIVSDGGSTDSTVAIANQFADIVVCPSNGSRQNIAVGRNLGANAASGMHYYIMNADTLIKETDYFFGETQTALGNNRIAALTCKVKVFPEEEIARDKAFHFCYNRYVRVLNFAGMGMGRGECHMIRSEVFRKSGGYNETMAAGEDFDMYRRISKFGKIKFIPQVTIYESPRRYRKYGYTSVFWDWTKNALSVIVKNKAISKVWEPVR